MHAKRLNAWLALLGWVWIPAIAFAGFTFIFAHDDLAGALLSAIAAVLALVVAISCFVLRAGPPLIVQLHGPVMVFVPWFSLFALAMLALLGRFPDQAALGRRYWVLYAIGIAGGFLLSWRAAWAVWRERARVLLRELAAGRPSDAVEHYITGNADVVPRRFGWVGPVGYGVYGLAAFVLGRGAVVWILTLASTAIWATAVTAGLMRFLSLASALREQRGSPALMRLGRQGDGKEPR